MLLSWLIVHISWYTHELHTLTYPFLALRTLSGITRVSRYQKGKTNLDFTEARDSNSPQTDNHTSTPPLSFLQAECPSCCPTNSTYDLGEKCSKIFYMLGTAIFTLQTVSMQWNLHNTHGHQFHLPVYIDRYLIIGVAVVVLTNKQ